jgi:CheY-like chemotaxis protein
LPLKYKASQTPISSTACIKNEFTPIPLLIPVVADFEPAKILVRSGSSKVMSRVSTAGEDLPGGLILVVEDDPLILEFLCEILQDEGYVVQPQSSADAASVYLQGHAPEVGMLLTDITMPGTLNGADLANLFGDRWPDKPIMIMSGFETPESSGVRHEVSFIKKPWALGQLLDCVDGALKSRRTL